MTPAAVMEILVRANTTAANAGLAKTEAQLAGASAAATRTTTATQKTGAMLRKMGTAAKWGGAALTAGFVIAAKKSIDTTNELTKSTLLLQKNFGLSGKAASEWAGVARARGVDSTKLGMAFKTLATQISSAAHGSDTAKQMFQELGFSQADIQKAMTDTQFAVGEVAAGFQDLPPGMEKATLAGKLFGRGWQTIFPILRDGKAAMQDQLDTVEKYGGVIAGKTLKQQEEFLAAQRETKIAWQGMEVTLGTALTPALVDANEQFQKIARILASNKLTSDEKFSKVADLLSRDFNQALDLVIDHIDEIASRAGQAGVKIAGGLVKGFVESDVWGQLAIGTFLVTKLGGWGAIGAIGRKIGTRIGVGVAAGEAAGAAGGITAAQVAGAGGVGAGAALAGVAGPVTAGMLAAFLLSKQGPDLSKAEALHQTTTHAMGRGIFKPTIDSLHTLQHDFQAVADDVGDNSHRVYRAMQGMSSKSRDALALWIKTQNSAGEVSDETSTRILKMLSRVGQEQEHMWRRAAKITGESVSEIKKSVGSQTKVFGSTYDGMVHVVGAGLNWLTSNTSKAAQALGSTNEVKFHTSPAATGPDHFGHRANLGGPVPGIGNTDTVPAMLTPGEFVVRKEATAANRALLEAINAKGFAAGGVVGGDTAGLVAPFLGALHSMSGATHTPIDVISGFRSRAEQAALYARYLAGTGNLAAAPGTSVHELGKAADISPGRERFGGVAGKFGMGFTVPSESWHIELLRAVAGMGAAPRIRRLLLKGAQGGLRLRDTGQASLDKVWRDANHYLHKKWAAMGQLNFVGGGGQFGKSQLASLWRSTGPGGDPNLMAAIGMAESGGNPQAVSSAGARGLWQIMPFWGGGNRLFDPTYNATKAHTVLAQQGLGAWSAYTNGAYQQYLRKGGMVMPPFAGSFREGGVVPGPIGSPRTVIAHGGEPIGRPVIRNEISVNFAPGTEWLRDFVRVEVEEGIKEENDHQRTIARMRP